MSVGLPLDRPIVGYVGRFLTMGEEKGIPELVRAMAIVPEIRGREPLLVCVGGPMSAVDNYRRIAAEAGTPEHRLLFVDHVPSTAVPTWTRALDVGASLLPNLPHYALYASSMKLFEYMAGEAAVSRATWLPRATWCVTARTGGSSLRPTFRRPPRRSRISWTTTSSERALWPGRPSMSGSPVGPSELERSEWQRASDGGNARRVSSGRVTRTLDRTVHVVGAQSLSAVVLAQGRSVNHGEMWRKHHSSNTATDHVAIPRHLRSPVDLLSGR